MMSVDAILCQVPQEIFPRSRHNDPRLAVYINQRPSLEPLNKDQIGFAIYGSPDDLGVRLNGGRAGASLGPNSIRSHLYKMTPPMDRPWGEQIVLCDLGNIQLGNDLNATHKNTERVSTYVGASGYIGISLGGGHDFAFPSFEGFSLAHTGGGDCGLINVDPHLDVREPDSGQAHSGTPFRMLIEGGVLAASNLVEFGVQAHRNSKAAYEYCLSRKVQLITMDRLIEGGGDVAACYEEALHGLAAKVQYIGATFDIDSCSECEGTSAAPVIGFTARELLAMSKITGRQCKVRHFELCEVAPSLDPTQRSSRIAAEMINAFLCARVEQFLA